MELKQIVTLASEGVRLRFLAMERSLRATGCALPIKVIPYNQERFDLPAGATWWEEPELMAWLARAGAKPTMRKYQCLLTSDYQFVDADVCFLRNPAEVLRPLSGFVTSCCHWHNTDDTVTPESRAWFWRRSTIWQKNIFNSGQWACDRVLYTLPALIAQAEAAEFVGTCLKHRFHEQPGVNQLVNATGVPVHNLTLPPGSMQSTWAGDYPGETDYRKYWDTEAATPYLIHWAGTASLAPRAIDQIFLGYLSAAEREAWRIQDAREARARDRERNKLRARFRRWRRLCRAAFTGTAG
jgi:hypothetical protein